MKKKTYDFHISSNENNAKVKVYDSVYKLPHKVEVIRSKKDLDVTLITQDSVVDYTIKSSPNPTFLYLNLVTFYLSPINYAVDFTNEKRFYYGRRAYLNTADSTRIIVPRIRKSWTNYFAQKYPRKKNDVLVSVSIPYVNGFNFRPKGFGTKVNTGFWGISAGLEYFYKPNRYVGLKFATATDFFVPIPAAVSVDDVRENLSTTYLELTDNFKFGRLHLGYGLNYSINNWRFIDETDINNTINFRQKNYSVGLTANVYFQFIKWCYVGVVYRPTFYNLRPKGEFDYEHLISLDFAFKIPIRKH